MTGDNILCIPLLDLNNQTIGRDFNFVLNVCHVPPMLNYLILLFISQCRCCSAFSQALCKPIH